MENWYIDDRTGDPWSTLLSAGTDILRSKLGASATPASPVQSQAKAPSGTWLPWALGGAALLLLGVVALRR